MANNMLNKKLLRETLRSKEVQLGEGYFDNLNKKVIELIDESIIRSKLNTRKTVYPKDL